MPYHHLHTQNPLPYHHLHTQNPSNPSAQEPPSPTSSSVASWLETLPPVRSFLAVETSARKRKATTTAPAGPVAKRAKRAALGAISYNAVVSDASPDRRKQKGKAQKELAASTSSPRKTRSRGKAPQQGQRTTPTKAERFQDEEDPTPRPAACRTFVPLNLDGAPRFSPPRDVSPSRSTTSRTTTESKRSKSPSRGMASREYMVDPIVTKQMDLLDNKMPAELHELAVQIDVFSNGCGIIPMRLKEHFAASLPHLPAAMIDAMVGANRHATGEAPSPSELTQIHLDARKLATKGHSEAAWNVDVHGPLLKKALLTSPHSTTLDSIVITTARISPPRLLPTDISGHKAESKMVDFGIVLQLPETLQRRIAQLTFPLGPALESLSQTTTYTPLRYNPVAVSIETKLPGQGLDNAQIQVSTWTFAQMRKLEELLALTGSVAAMAGEKMVEGELPVLPLVVVLGHEWYFLAMTRVREGSVRGQVETTLWSNILIGSTQTLEGIYKVLAAKSKNLNAAKRREPQRRYGRSHDAACLETPTARIESDKQDCTPSGL